MGSGSPFSGGITASRAAFNAMYTPTGSFQQANVPVTVTGVPMFDFGHGQTGAAPNYIELHPVLSICIGTDCMGGPPPDMSGPHHDMAHAPDMSGPHHDMAHAPDMSGHAPDMSSPHHDMAHAPDMTSHPPDMSVGHPDMAGSCAHSICVAGTKLVSGCDPCVTKICATDSYCCKTKWSSICVEEVASICGESCSAMDAPAEAVDTGRAP